MWKQLTARTFGQGKLAPLGWLLLFVLIYVLPAAQWQDVFEKRILPQIAAFATPEKADTLLTCHGSKIFTTSSSVEPSSDSVDVGVIINSTKRTVTVAGYETYPFSVMPGDAEIHFDNSDYSKKQITRGMGTFDRLSGSLTFASHYIPNDHWMQSEYFDLRCKPAQRIY
jgi:hypothetical protein